MKLANIHKHYVALLLIIGGFQSAQAQTWTLQQCIDTAQVHNKNLQMSRNNMAIGDQREKEAKANLIPKVTANADYKRIQGYAVWRSPQHKRKLATFNAFV